MRILRTSWLILVVLTILLVSCNQVPEQIPLASTEKEITPPAPPAEGSATIIGRVVSKTTQEPLPEMIVRLADVYRQGGEGAYVLDVANSPSTLTDAKGYFIFENVSALEYVIVVGDVYLEYKVVGDQEGKPRVWNALANEITDVGELAVDLNP